MPHFDHKLSDELLHAVKHLGATAQLYEGDGHDGPSQYDCHPSVDGLPPLLISGQSTIEPESVTIHLLAEPNTLSLFLYTEDENLQYVSKERTPKKRKHLYWKALALHATICAGADPEHLGFKEI